jgi:hypothetical protein
MGLFPNLRKRVFRRGPGVEKVPILGQGIKSGQVRPEDLSLDNDRHQTPILEDQAKKPWYDIGGFMKSVKERNQRIGLGATRKKQLLSREEANQAQNIILAPPPLPNLGAPVDQKKQGRAKDAGDVVATGGAPSTSLLVPSTKTAKRDDVESTEAGSLVGITVHPDASTEAATLGEGSDWEALLEAQSDIAADNGLSDLGLILCGQGCISPSTLQWHISAVTIIDGQGLEQSEKLMYDTGSVANLSTPKFASAHFLAQRPLLPEDFVTYITPIGPLTPTHYVEVQMKDPKHGINNFVPIRLLMVETLNGFGLLLGRGFMTQYRVVLDPSQGSDMYPVIARAPGPGQLASMPVRRKYANFMY